MYDVFTVKDGEQIFLAAVSDTQWALMCREFGFDDLAADPRLATNNDRVRARDWMMPLLRERFAELRRCRTGRSASRRNGLPYRADHATAGSVRRPAPARHRRAGAGHACRRTSAAPAARSRHAPRCCLWPSTASACPCACRRLPSARRPTRCCIRSATAATRSLHCAPPT